MRDNDYAEAFETDARHLVRLAKKGRLGHVDCRESDIKATLEQLRKGRSTLLIGATGVGKTSIIHGVAQSLAGRGFGAIAEFSTVSLMSGTRYLGEWQTKVGKIVDAAVQSTTVLYISDIQNLPKAGSTSNSNIGMWAAMKPHVESGALTLLGEANPETLAAMQRVPGFAELFTKVAVEPLLEPAVLQVLTLAAQRKKLDIHKDALAAMVQLTTRFLPARPQPGPALALLGQVRDYQVQKNQINEPEPADTAFIERVFSIYSGLPRFIVSRTETRKASDIRSWFKERIVGQSEAIEAVVQAIALFKSGLSDPKKPLGTFLFVGPTGVGKTELARTLAQFLYGSPHRLLRFDLSEFKDFHAFEALLGRPSHPNEPARLVDPVRAQPFQVILFDEIEKAHRNVWDVLLSLLDEGRLTTPAGETIDFRSTFIIATSNVGAADADKQLGFGGDDGGERRRQRIWQSLEAAFRPEFLARFGHVALFHPLKEEHVRRIARHELRGILKREGITSRNLVVDVDDEALSLVMQRGFDTKWGARGMSREIQRQIVMPLALTLMERNITPGQVLKVTGVDGHIRVRRLDTEVSRAVIREAAPIKLAGRPCSRDDLKAALGTLRDNVATLALEADEPFLLEERERLTVLRSEPAFWQHPEAAARTLRDLDIAQLGCDRLDRIRQRVDAFEVDLKRSDTRERLLGLGRRVDQLEAVLEGAFREMVYMGRAGYFDALVQIRPVAGDPLARNFLVRMYQKWAAGQGFEWDWLLEPHDGEDAAMFAIKGDYAFGLLRAEAGMHKLRDAEQHGVAQIRVGAWSLGTAPLEFGEHWALKRIGAFGGRVRSRLACANGLVLQNHRTLAENRSLAMEVAQSWAGAADAGDSIVRRYDLTAPLVRDTLTGLASGRPDAVAPARFHSLLCRRVELLGLPPEAA